MKIFSVVWILTMIFAIVFRNKELVIDWSNGIKVSIDEKEISMRNGRKPTRNEKMFLSKNKLSPDNWLIISNDKNELKIVNRKSRKVRILEYGK